MNLPLSFKKFIYSLQNVKQAANKVDLSREEIILKRLEQKLGKTKEEVNLLISRDLMELLVQVPFNNSSDTEEIHGE